MSVLQHLGHAGRQRPALRVAAAGRGGEFAIGDLDAAGLLLVQPDDFV